jgi:hypothetical protein
MLNLVKGALDKKEPPVFCAGGLLFAQERRFLKQRILLAGFC